MSGEYTVLLKEIYSDNLISEEEILCTLSNENDDFKEFSESLNDFIKWIHPGNESAGNTLKKLAKDKQIPLNRNTIDNWLNGLTPRKSEESRENIYKVAFALNLDIENTIDLFVKVYKDRPFDVRRLNEFIYYISLKNSFTYDHAQKLIEQCSLITSEEGKYTSHTMKLLEVADMLREDNDIFEYVGNNIANFNVHNVSAKRVLAALIEKIQVKDYEVELIKRNMISFKNSVMSRELVENSDLVRTNHSMTSISTMLNVIYGSCLTKLISESGKGFLKNSQLPKEIYSRFPTKHTFSKKEPSYEEIRKMIILLASYKYWINIRDNKEFEPDFLDYQEEINGYLLDANMAELYPGNRFDWFFLCCNCLGYVNDNDPLEIFRSIINEALEE